MPNKGSTYLPFANEKFRNSIRAYILKRGGSEFDVEEVLGDATLAFLESKESKNGRSNESLDKYCFGIARFIWIKRSKSKFSHDELSEILQVAGDMDAEKEVKDQASSLKREFLHELLDGCGKNCKEILLRKFQGDRARKIAEDLNSTEDAINTRGNQCKNKLITKAIGLLDADSQQLMRIFDMKHAKKWKTEAYKQTHNQTLLDMGFTSFEEAREQATALREQLFSFLYPTS